MSEWKSNPMNDFCNTEVGKLLRDRITNMDTETRLEAASMCQMFSFWKEIQNTLIAGVEEIKRLKARISELEAANER